MKKHQNSKVPVTHSSSQGQVMAEYIVVSVFFGLFVWYAIVGGSVTATGPTGTEGGWMETQADVLGTGNKYDEYRPGDAPMPGLIQAIHSKQETFTDSIYQP